MVPAPSASSRPGKPARAREDEPMPGKTCTLDPEAPPQPTKGGRGPRRCHGRHGHRPRRRHPRHGGDGWAYGGRPRAVADADHARGDCPGQITSRGRTYGLATRQRSPAYPPTQLRGELAKSLGAARAALVVHVDDPDRVMRHRAGDRKDRAVGRPGTPRRARASRRPGRRRAGGCARRRPGRATRTREWTRTRTRAGRRGRFPRREGHAS